MNKEENKSIEYKSVFEEDIKHEILGFLNTSGGIIYVGINDDKTINKEFLNVNRKEIELQLSNWVETIISPSVFGLVSHTFTENGVLVINVQEGHKKPYYLKGKGPKPVGVYKRIGSTTRKASEEEIMMMLLDSRNYVFEKETSENQKLTFKYLSSVFKEKNISFTKRNQISLGLVDNNGFYTNLALLLSDQSEITVKLAEYDYKMNFKIKREFKGCLIKIFKEVEEQVERLNDTSAIIDGKTFERKERKSYPEVSLREIILNAFCHTNYMIKSNIKIEFFQSYVKITSPGGLYLASMEEIMSGIQTYRNPKLVRILDKLKFIENYGTGILRVKQEYKNHFIKPEFYDMGNFFVVKLPNINYKNKIDQIKSSDRINDEITDQIKSSDRINDETIDQIKSSDQINDEITDQIKSSDRINDEITDQIKLSDQINDEINDQIKSSDQINDEINDQIKSSDRINDETIDQIKSSDRINDETIDQIKSSDQINDQIKSSDQINDEINDQIKSSDQINDKTNDQIKSSDQINDEINDQIKSSDQINDEINDQIKSSDQINDKTNDQIKSSDQINILRKSILLIIKNHPGIKVNEILEQLVCMNIYTSITTIQNQLRRKLSKYVVYIGSRKTGGYYFKQDIKEK